MAQHDYNIANQTGAQFRSDLNDALAAIVSNNSGATAPATTYAHQWWADTTAGILKRRNAANDAWISVLTLSTGEPVGLGTTIQPYDADTLKADVADTLTASFRGSVTTDNDLSFDMNATNNFKCTPTGNGTLTFTNITSGQSGNIWLDNSGGYVISAAATTYISSADLTAISTAGVYFLSYYADGTNVLVASSPALTSTGA